MLLVFVVVVQLIVSSCMYVQEPAIATIVRPSSTWVSCVTTCTAGATVAVTRGCASATKATPGHRAKLAHAATSTAATMAGAVKEFAPATPDTMATIARHVAGVAS